MAKVTVEKQKKSEKHFRLGEVVIDEVGVAYIITAVYSSEVPVAYDVTKLSTGTHFSKQYMKYATLLQGPLTLENE